MSDVPTNAVGLDGWLAYMESQHPRSIDLGLDRVREVAARLGLGRPAAQVITIAGTNGKGSTVAFVESIARAGGWKVGAYTSPHLLRYNERVRIDGEEASDEALVAAFLAVEAARGGTSLTYFEYGTLAALWLFERAALDLAVLEIGLGGRLDAVNIVDPDVAVVTTVDVDHADWLGSDRETIGREKAGIARAWKPLVLGEVDPPSSVLRHAYAIGANAIRLGSDFFHEPAEDGHWRWRDVGAELLLPAPFLAAPSQRANAATAIAALRALPRSPDDAAYAQGVAAARLAGRLQRFERDGIEVVVDVAHNPQAARELAAWLRAQPAAGATAAVFAALADKDAAAMVEPLAASVSRWHLAGLAENPRGLDVDAFAARLVHADAVGSASRDVGVAEALERAIAASSPGDRVLVFGSFHTAAAAMTALHSGR
ncbi:bifunctional tetrahydrofolate synthase/dihydrofolate synthase [Pseudoxanthomonas daejeonensis]|uniref:Dihydrofolate synthase/folylpolyglutamate synthase n=1 Tax=Pseudoxanthomonas daejeonensis TaxID=266062 RepID=A0ABQ6Z5D4_9GAMM|nr:bifunctional tetrahydrofolate synthase/dihydrofolate synthase [Pseudoxanthomonas daejeonensis]KAF1693502.1 bifunctional tetrahydrofolate synthase/dihydrofolate synthase [Pseudoxanthomonas daejeonensis]UNK57955.1 bifunctional tetrahydrofolate synthase/dihydrofolate synthase [Pseudoxanthomonas daejeonensis]